MNNVDRWPGTRTILKIVGSLCLLTFVGCTVGPDYTRPPVVDPGQFREESVAGESIANLAWWELFEDPVLHDLIETTLQQNRNRRAAVARIDEAAAVLGIVRADLYPRVFYGGDGSFSGTTASDGDASTEGSLFLSAGWQIDLWGKFRRANEAAYQQLLATEESYRGVTISLVAAVASTYLVLRDLDARLAIAEQTVEIRRQNVDIIQARFDGGSVTEVDLNQSQIQLHEAEASVQVFERLRRQTENALSLLLGQPPLNIERGLALAEQIDMPKLPAGLPSELLERRPDVLVAERQLHAQTARIGVAEALKYPQFDLSAALGASFAEISSGFFELGAQLVGPLYNSGELQRNVDAEVARTTQLLNQYEQAILNAYREVEDALVALRTYRSELEARERQAEAAENAANLAWVRYEGGLTSYLEILETQRALFASQLAVSETRQLSLNAIVDLYEALGGGWVVENALPDRPGVSGEVPNRGNSSPR
jgi:multidrug efflux system outer membrane protein